MKTRCREAVDRSMTALAVILAVTVLTQAKETPASERLFFSTDVHNKPGQLENQLKYNCLNSAGQNICNFVGLVGDLNFGDPNVLYSTDADIESLIGEDGYIDDTLGDEGVDYNVALSQGNHDEYGNDYFDDGNHPSGFVALSNNELYDIYRINTEDFGAICSQLDSDLYQLGPDYNKVIFVMSHFPLHSDRYDIDAAAASCIFEILQDAAVNYGREIVFLWGHNHYRPGRPNYDENVRMIAGPGNTVAEDVTVAPPSPYLNSNAFEALEFSYVNAGYTIAASEENPEMSSSTVFVVIDTWIAIMRYIGNTNSGGFKLVQRKPWRD